MKKHIFLSLLSILVTITLTSLWRNGYFEKQENVDSQKTFDLQYSQDFISGEKYSFFNDDKEVMWTYLRTLENSHRAVFLDENNQEVSFYPNVFFTVLEKKDTRDINRFIKESEDVTEYKKLKTLNMYVVSFENPYTAYDYYLLFKNDSRLKGVGLDMYLSTEQM